LAGVAEQTGMTGLSVVPIETGRSAVLFGHYDEPTPPVKAMI
jgi:hypothetical protein